MLKRNLTNGNVNRAARNAVITAYLESARRLVEAGLNAATDKAYGMVDGSAKDWRRHRTIVSQALGRFPASSL